MNHLVFLRAFCTVLALLHWPAVAQAQAERLTLTGSSTLAPLMAELAKRFMALHPAVSLAVESGGSGRGVADARSGKADIGMVSRAMHPDESDLFVFTIARDGIALVVHGDNPVRSLSRAQLTAVLSGAATNWKAVGGADAPIHISSRKPGHASLEIVSHFFGLSPQQIKAHRVVGDNDEALQAVLADRQSMSFFSVGLLEDSVQKGLLLRALALDGVAASSATVKNGQYPLARPLNLVTRGVPKGTARAFIEFVQSARARAVIAEYDFVPYGH